MKQYYQIAGLTVEMSSFGRTAAQAIPYRICNSSINNPDISVRSNIEEARQHFLHLSDDECEYLASGKAFFTELLKHDGIQLHSSSVIVDGKAYLFSASCGTGKSTHVSIWRQVLGDECVRVLNDDKPALRLENGIWYAYGTPWSGKTGQNLNLKAPVAGIALIERGENNEIYPISGREVVVAIYKQTNKVESPELRIKLLELLDKLITQVPIWKLKCNMDPEAAVVAYEAMSGQKYEGDWK